MDTAQRDQYFRERCDTVDDSTPEQRKKMLKLAREIADELDESTWVISTALPGTRDGLKTLDLGMAPGGFSSAVLKTQPMSMIRGITLPMKLGGKKLLLPGWQTDERVVVKFTDVSMLADEMGSPAASISPSHPEYAKFSSEKLFSDERFDLIFCGASYDSAANNLPVTSSIESPTKDQIRLRASQLVVARRRIREGGILVVLMHKVESWDTFELIHMFTDFSDISLFKPKKKHAFCSSFFMVARNVRPRSFAALATIRLYISRWKVATFETESGAHTLPRVPDNVGDILEGFGSKFISLATPVWEVQADALRSSSS